MNFCEFKDRVQVFQSRVESSMSVKRCNNANNEANNKQVQKIHKALTATVLAKSVQNGLPK